MRLMEFLWATFKWWDWVWDWMGLGLVRWFGNTVQIGFYFVKD